MCFFRERKAVSSRYHYAAFCGEHRFSITITFICVALQHLRRLTTSIRCWCVENQMVYFLLCGIPSSVTWYGDKHADQSWERLCWWIQYTNVRRSTLSKFSTRGHRKLYVIFWRVRVMFILLRMR
jgi:hypothetical protein